MGLVGRVGLVGRIHRYPIRWVHPRIPTYLAYPAYLAHPTYQMPTCPRTDAISFSES